MDPPVWEEEVEQDKRVPKRIQKGAGVSGPKMSGDLLTADAAVHHPADHAEQEEQVTHEVAMIAASCEGGKTPKKQPPRISNVLVWLIFDVQKYPGNN